MNKNSDIFVRLFIIVIALFKSNQFLTALLLLPYTLLLRINTIINPQAYELLETDTAFSHYVFSEIFPNARIQALVANVLIFLIANFINRLVIQNRISKFLTLLPGLMFILFCSIFKEGLILSPVLFSCFFIILGILSLNRTYKNREAAIQLFNIGAYFALATFFYTPSFILWIFGLISLLNLRSLKLPELMIYFSGLIVPLFILGVVYYWNDQFALISSYFQFNHRFVSQILNFTRIEIFTFLFFILCIAFVLLRYNSYTMRNPIQIKKKIDIIYWLLAFSFVMVFFTEVLQPMHLLILAMPLSAFIGLSYEKMKSGLLGELIHIFLIIFILFAQFQFFN